MITQFSAHEKYDSLKSYINLPHFYPAGRLDSDSEGLLLLTNKGELQTRITSPKFKLTKTYWAQVEGQISEQAILQLQKGVKLKEFTTLPAMVWQKTEPNHLWNRTPPIRERKQIPTSWIEISIIEGKNRQIRRMCAAVGFPCLRLIRVQIGKLNLFDFSLAQGQWKKIAISDII